MRETSGDQSALAGFLLLSASPASANDTGNDLHDWYQQRRESFGRSMANGWAILHSNPLDEFNVDDQLCCATGCIKFVERRPFADPNALVGKVASEHLGLLDVGRLEVPIPGNGFETGDRLGNGVNSLLAVALRR
jgi:hypothetical protein